jgi:SAM-dependent methyltransferase
VDVYHELANPEETIAQVRRALKPGGRLVLIEYRGEDPTVPIKPEHKMTLKQIHEELEPMGFRVQETFDFLPRQHVIVLVPTKPEASSAPLSPLSFGSGNFWENADLSADSKRHKWVYEFQVPSFESKKEQLGMRAHIDESKQ